MMAVTKGSEGSISIFAEYISHHTSDFCNEILDELILLPRKWDKNTTLLQLEYSTLLELCIERKNVLLRSSLRSVVYHYNIQRVFETAF